MQFRVIVVTDPQTNKHTHKPTDRTDYIALQHSFASMQCNDSGDSVVTAVRVMMCVCLCQVLSMKQSLLVDSGATCTSTTKRNVSPLLFYNASWPLFIIAL